MRLIFALALAAALALSPGPLVAAAAGAAIAILCWLAPRFGGWGFGLYGLAGASTLLLEGTLLTWQSWLAAIALVGLLDDHIRKPGAETGRPAVAILAAGIAAAGWLLWAWPPTRASLFAPDSQAAAILLLAALGLLAAVGFAGTDPRPTSPDPPEP